jgi:spermidine/putrescine transport system permease protein
MSAEPVKADVAPRGMGSGLRTLLLFGPPFAFVAVFLVYPYLNVFAFSFYRVEDFTIVRDFNLSNYLKALTTPLYLQIILQSLRIGLIVTLCTLPIAYVLAYYTAFVARKRRQLLYFLIVTPLWTSFLLRVFVWKLILGRTGLINGALVSSGIVEEPLSILLYNEFSVCLALVYIFIPFFFLPIYTALERIDPAYLEASADLGAPPLATFWRVVVPLSMPGVVTGAIFTFCLSFGDFVTPALVGGPSGLMISNVIINQFGAAFDWPFGSALAVIVLATVMIVVALGARAERRDAEVVS